MGWAVGGGAAVVPRGSFPKVKIGWGNDVKKKNPQIFRFKRATVHKQISSYPCC